MDFDTNKIIDLSFNVGTKDFLNLIFCFRSINLAL